MASTIAPASSLPRGVAPLPRPAVTIPEEFNYSEMDSETLRGILKVTASTHPQAPLIGDILQKRNRRHANRSHLECAPDIMASWADDALELKRAEVDAILEQDLADRNNLMRSSGMSLVILDEEVRAKYEEVHHMLTIEIDARAIEASPIPAEDAEQMAADYAEQQEEDARCARMLAAGKCPYCERLTADFHDRFGNCLGCEDDAERRADREAAREARDFTYMNGLRISRAALHGQAC